MGNEASKSELNNKNHSNKEKELSSQIDQEIENLEEALRVSYISKNRNFYTVSSKDEKISEPQMILINQSEKFEAPENSDQQSEIPDINNLNISNDEIIIDNNYKEENFKKDCSPTIATQLAKSGTVSCLKGVSKAISSKWSFISAAAIAIYEVSGVYRLYSKRKIDDKEFSKHVGRSAITTISVLPGTELGSSLGIGIGVACGLATGGLGLIAAGILGAFLGGSATSLLSGAIYDKIVEVKSEEELIILAARDVYLKALSKYQANENTPINELREKRNDFMRSYHPDRFKDSRLKEKFSKKLIKYMQYFEIIRIHRKY